MCKSISSKNKYTLVLDDDGIYVEQFDSTNNDENRFNRNNIIFTEGKTFTYAFEHIDKNNSKKSFKYIDSISNWEFVPFFKYDKDKIAQITITVKKGLNPLIKMIPDYNQTILSYSYQSKFGLGDFGSFSGVIENENNVWMHPPRDEYFKILELNPFPYIKSPNKIGNSWSWALSIGEYWADPRWKVWNGAIENSYHYEITDRVILDTNFGKIKCLVVESSAKSRLGETKLISYFNKKYGFVKLSYTNIDSSKTNLRLIKVHK